MREALITLVIVSAMIFGLTSAQGSLAVLNWVWFQRPQEFSDGFWAQFPIFLLALAIAVGSNVVRGKFKPKFPPILVIYLVLLVWVTLSTCFAFNTVQAWAFYKTFLPSMWISPIVMFATVHELRTLRIVLWASAGSLAINGAKSGLGNALHGGGVITEHINGFVGDNNVFALTLCVAVAILMGIRKSLPQKRWVRVGFYLILGLALLCIVFTKSRGALLTLGVIFVVGSMLGPRPARSLLLLFGVSVVGFFLIPASYFDRLSTLQDVQADTSAMGRVENWGLAWRAAVANPIFGVGPENHFLYNQSLHPDVQVRVAHSVYFEVLGELGFPGLFLYLIFVVMGVTLLVRTWRALIPIAAMHPDLAWTRETAFWCLCGYVGYLFGSGLLNSFYIEFPWYAVLYGSMLLPLVKAEVASRADTLTQKVDARGGNALHAKMKPRTGRLIYGQPRSPR